MKNFILILINFVFFINSLEYKKNKHIKLQKKDSNTTRVIDIEQSDLIQNKLDLKKSNFILIFYSDWCIHCKELLETLDTVSSYELAKGIDFLKVDCSKFKDICSNYGIYSYPTMKVYIKGEETTQTPNGKELETLLEYVDKINSPNIIEIKNDKSIMKYSDDYGDNSFLLINNHDINDNLNICFKRLAESPQFKPLFYFFTLQANKFKNVNNIKLPAILVI